MARSSSAAAAGLLVGAGFGAWVLLRIDKVRLAGPTSALFAPVAAVASFGVTAMAADVGQYLPNQTWTAVVVSALFCIAGFLSGLVARAVVLAVSQLRSGGPGSPT